MNKRLFLSLILVSNTAFACGCVDANMAITEANAVTTSYLANDLELAKSLDGLGQVIQSSYRSQNNASLDAERIARIKTMQATVLQRVEFETGKMVDLASVENNLGAKEGEASLLQAEKISAKKSIILNKKGVLEE